MQSTHILCNANRMFKANRKDFLGGSLCLMVDVLPNKKSFLYTRVPSVLGLSSFPRFRKNSLLATLWVQCLDGENYFFILKEYLIKVLSRQRKLSWPIIKSLLLFFFFFRLASAWPYSLKFKFQAVQKHANVFKIMKYLTKSTQDNNKLIGFWSFFLIDLEVLP